MLLGCMTWALERAGTANIGQGVELCGHGHIECSGRALACNCLRLWTSDAFMGNHWRPAHTTWRCNCPVHGMGHAKPMRVQWLNLPDTALSRVYDLCSTMQKVRLRCCCKKLNTLSRGSSWGDVVLDVHSLRCFMGSCSSGPSKSLLKFLVKNAGNMTSIKLAWYGNDAIGEDALLWATR